MKKILTAILLIGSLQGWAQTRNYFTTRGGGGASDTNYINGKIAQNIDPDYIITADPANGIFATAIGKGDLPDFSGFSSTVWNNVIGVLCAQDEANNGNSGGGRIRSSGVFNTYGVPLHIRGWHNGQVPQTALEIDGGLTTVISQSANFVNAFECTNGAAVILKNISININADSGYSAVRLFTDSTEAQQTEPSVWKFQASNISMGSGSKLKPCFDAENFFGLTVKDASIRGFNYTSMRLSNNSEFTNFGNSSFGGSLEFLAPDRDDCAGIEISSTTDNHIMNLLHFEGAVNIGTPAFSPGQTHGVGIRVRGGGYTTFGSVDIEYMPNAIRIENGREINFLGGYIHPDGPNGVAVAVSPQSNGNSFAGLLSVDANTAWIIRDSTLTTPNNYNFDLEGYPDTSKIYVAKRSKTKINLRQNGEDWQSYELPGVSIKGPFKISSTVNNGTLTTDASGNVTSKTITGTIAIVAENDLTPIVDKNTFHIVGTTDINAVKVATLQDGATITLIFDGSVTVKNNTVGTEGTIPMILAGGVDFSATINDALTFKVDLLNNKLYEVSRSIN